MQICTLLIVASDAGWWRYPRRRIQFGTLGKRDISPVWCHRFVNPDKTTAAMCRGVCDFIQFCTAISFPCRYRRRTRRSHVRELGIRPVDRSDLDAEINNFAFCIHDVMQISNVFFHMCILSFFYFRTSSIMHATCFSFCLYKHRYWILHFTHIRLNE